MEAITMKTEKDKLEELEDLLADVSFSGDETDEGDSLLSSASDAATPIPNHQAQSGSCRDLTMRTPPAWCTADRRPSTSASNGRPENERENLNNSLSSDADNSPRKNPITARRKSRRSSGCDRSNIQQHRDHDALVMKLQSELAATRSELERKDILVTSLKHQLDQRRHIEEQTQARSEQDLAVALAEVSALKKELERTCQLLMDGAVARQQLEQRCSVLKQELEQSDARAKELEEEVFEARVQITKVSNELYSRRSTSVEDAEITFAEEVQRVEAKAKREIDALREEAGTLRAALERRTSLYEEACSERDTARHEAEEAAENINNLRQEVWSWKDRAEELEHLEQTERTGSPPRDEETYLNEAEETIKALKRNLAELQESMEKAREDAATSRGVAAEESAKRAEAETRLETMEMEAKAGAKADREVIWTRRISKLKIAMKEEMGAEMDRVRSELQAESDAVIEEQRLRVQKLGEELQESEREKTRLEQSVKEQFERAKAIELEYQRALKGIQVLHDSTMAIVLEAGINMAG